MKMASALRLAVPMILLLGCHNIEDDAQRFRNIDIDLNNTYKIFNAQFGVGVKETCEPNVITVDCSEVRWPSTSGAFPLISAGFHAEFDGGFTGLGRNWKIDDNAKPFSVAINRHFRGKVCGERFIFEDQTICGQRAKPLENAFGTVWALGWERSPNDSDDEGNVGNAIGRISSGMFTPMPPPQVFGGSGPGSPRLTIENGTQYTIQVYLSGPETRSVTVPAGGSEILDLQAGAFKLAAEIPSHSISPFYGEQTFNNGTAYVEKFLEVVRR
jgi:hypothetical protein